MTSKTKKGARRKLDTIKKQIQHHGTALDTKTALEQWATHWLETVGKPSLKPNTLLSYDCGCDVRDIACPLGNR